MRRKISKIDKFNYNNQKNRWDVKSMEFRQLNTFVTVAKLNNFTQAADQLGYAQSSVTSQIQLLEKELGVRLFERIGKSISLTPQGEKLLIYAKQILKLCDEAKNVVTASDLLRGTLTIGSIESLCAVRLPQLFKEYHKRYPEVEIILKMGSCNEFKSLLQENQIDVAFFLDQKLCVPELASELEQLEPLCILAAPEHPLTRNPEVYPENLAGYPLILTETGCSYRTLFLKILAESGITPKSILETGSIQTIKQLTMSGLGVTLLPRAAVEEELERKQLVELAWMGPPFEMLTQVVYHKDKWISPALRAFLDLSKEML